MTGLFIRFYVCVLAVLAVAWYIHGGVLTRRAAADRARVTIAAHAGGARLLASELNRVPAAARSKVLEDQRKRFAYPVDIMPTRELPNSLQRQITQGGDVFFYAPDDSTSVIATLSPPTEVVRLGPFPSYRLREIEEAIGGWMRLAAKRIESSSITDRNQCLTEVRERFDFPVSLISSTDILPKWPRKRMLDGDDVVFYSDDSDNWYSASPLEQGKEIVVFGPFPHFDQIEHKAATTTLTLVLLPVAVAIALLLRPVAKELRYVERAAGAIAGGNLSARVDERRVRSAKSLAQSFNHMAERTESLVRAQRELLQAVSHELRTPLCRMKFAIELISTAKDDRERQLRLESLDTATEELDELIEELLTYVRADTVAPLLNRERISVDVALEQVISRYKTLFRSVQFELQPGSPSSETFVLADPAAFQRALGNLLGNAGRFAESRVVISFLSVGETTTIDVDDDGHGIPTSDRERVFEPFVRLATPTQCDVRSAGLGLALVKRIATQHGGSVAALDSPLGGCRIRTTWPKGCPQNDSETISARPHCSA